LDFSPHTPGAPALELDPDFQEHRPAPPLLRGTTPTTTDFFFISKNDNIIAIVLNQHSAYRHRAHSALGLGNITAIVLNQYYSDLFFISKNTALLCSSTPRGATISGRRLPEFHDHFRCKRNTRTTTTG
jgi:hypothetical protein